jgi:hypothetical protein
LLESDRLAESSVLEVDAIMELLEVCLKTKYFQVDNKFFQKKKERKHGYGELSVSNGKQHLSGAF